MGRDSVLIGGFILSGSDLMKVILLALGPLNGRVGAWRRFFSSQQIVVESEDASLALVLARAPGFPT